MKRPRVIGPVIEIDHLGAAIVPEQNLIVRWQMLPEYLIERRLKRGYWK